MTLYVSVFKWEALLLPSVPPRSHQDFGIDGRWRQDVISRQPQSSWPMWKAVIMDLKTGRHGEIVKGTPSPVNLQSSTTKAVREMCWRRLGWVVVAGWELEEPAH